MHNPDGTFITLGVHSQRVYIDPAAERVTVRFVSHTVAANAASDGVTLPAYAAIAHYLIANPGACPHLVTSLKREQALVRTR